MQDLCSEQASTGDPQQCSQQPEVLKLSFSSTSTPDGETQPAGYGRSLALARWPHKNTRKLLSSRPYFRGEKLTLRIIKEGCAFIGLGTPCLEPSSQTTHYHRVSALYQAELLQVLGMETWTRQTNSLPAPLPQRSSHSRWESRATLTDADVPRQDHLQ